MTQQDIEYFISNAKDFLCDLSGYVGMYTEPYSDGTQYPVIEEELIMRDFETYIREHIKAQ